MGFVITSLPPGPDRVARDVGFAETLKFTDPDQQDMSDSEILAQLWGEYIVRYSYNAKEAADEWWMMWGSKMREYA